MSSTQYEQSDKGKESTSKSIILGGKNLFLQNFTPRQEDFHSQKLSSTFKIICDSKSKQTVIGESVSWKLFSHSRYLQLKEYTNKEGKYVYSKETVISRNFLPQSGIQRAYQQSGIQRAYQQGSRTCFQETFVPSPAFLLFSFPSTKLPFFCSTSGGGP